VKSASEEDAALKLCVIVCTNLKNNMRVGCHSSVVFKDQLILKIVYDKKLSLICRIFSAVLLKNYLASLFIMATLTTGFNRSVADLFRLARNWLCSIPNGSTAEKIINVDSSREFTFLSRVKCRGWKVECRRSNVEG
jgi:hypothetical protein